MNLIDLLQKHKATMSIPLPDGVGSAYSEFHAYIHFADQQIKVDVFNDEGCHYDISEDGALDIRWLEAITAFVTDLKEAKAIPNYTLELPTPDNPTS